MVAARHLLGCHQVHEFGATDRGGAGDGECMSATHSHCIRDNPQQLCVVARAEHATSGTSKHHTTPDSIMAKDIRSGVWGRDVHGEFSQLVANPNPPGNLSAPQTTQAMMQAGNRSYQSPATILVRAQPRYKAQMQVPLTPMQHCHSTVTANMMHASSVRLQTTQPCYCGESRTCACFLPAGSRSLVPTFKSAGINCLFG